MRIRKMQKTRNMVLGVLALVLVLGGCGAPSVKMKSLEILGEWADYLELVPGKSVFEINDSNKNDVELLVSVTFQLKKTWEAGAKDETTFVLVPITKNRIRISNENFTVADTGRLNELVQRSPGTTIAVTFHRDASTIRMKKSEAKKLAKSIGGFEGRTIETSAARRYIVAVAPFSVNANLRGDVARGMVLEGLRNNPEASNFSYVDTSQTDTILKQHNFEASDWSSQEKVAAIGKALNATIIVTGAVEQISDGSITYTFTVLNINTMEVIGVSAGTVKKLADITDRVRTMRITLPSIW